MPANSIRRQSTNADAPLLIVGGGIGGLATALALARRGIASHVLERRAQFFEEGAGIQIGPNGTRILQQLGIADALRPLVGMPEALSVRDGPTGSELTRLPLGEWMAARYGAPYWVAHRKDLHDALAQAVAAEQSITLTMGFAATELGGDGEQITVSSEGGSIATGRALVAADGIFSPLRRQLFKTREPRFSGKTAARCVIATDALPAEFRRRETTIWLFSDAHVVHYPVRAGQELAVVVVVDDCDGDAEWNAPVEAGWVQQRLPSGAGALHSLIASGSSWRSWSLHTLKTPPRWTSGRATLLGDAAHPVLPFLAQGAVMALEDASVLAQALDGRDDISAALQSYERQRRARVTKVARASRRNGRIYHMRGMRAAARNMVLRKSSPERFMAQYDWLYGWRND